MIYDTHIGSFYNRLDMCKQGTVIGIGLEVEIPDSGSP